MLRKVITSGTGRGANIGKPMGGKTGTTNENKDAWFIGYTPDLVTGVFIGNDNNKSIGLTGGSAPARIWKDMMTVATKKYGSPEFDYPEVNLNAEYDDIKIDPNVDLESDNQGEDTETEKEKKFWKFGKDKEQSDDKSSNERSSNVKTESAENFKSIPVQVTVPLDLEKLKSEKAGKRTETNKIPNMQTPQKNNNIGFPQP